MMTSVGQNTRMIKRSSKSLFLIPEWVALFAFIAAFAWGWAYPLIKLGFAEFGIAQDMTGSKMLFAGIRFCLSGVIILMIAKFTGRSFALKETGRKRVIGSCLFLLLFTLLNTTLHYAAFYIGLSHSLGSRAAILNSLSVFILVILACVFFRSDKLTYRKILGCVIGFLGILALNLGGEDSGVGRWFDYSECPLWRFCRIDDTRGQSARGCVCGYRL